MRRTQIHFSKRETVDLLKSWGVVSLVFAIAYAGFGLNKEFAITILFAGITAGIAFVLHELAHKFVANYFGCAAEYKANTTMLLFALLIVVVFKAIFIAPGAVMVRGAFSKKENGIISAAGPATNIVLAIIFFGTSFITGPNLIVTLGLLINAWLALFNMIPVLPFDGRKVWVWNKTVYIVMAVISALLVFGGLV